MPDRVLNKVSWPRHIVGNGWRVMTAPWRQRKIGLDRATSIFGCSFGTNGWHPIIETLKEYIDAPNINWRETTLYGYHKYFRPGTMAELVYAPRDCCDIPLFSFPWGTFRLCAREKKNVWVSRFCGPSSDEFIESEYRRIIALYEGLKSEGYRPWKYGNGFIGGSYLHCNDGDWRFVVLQGNHRMAALSVLGRNEVAVRTFPGFISAVRESELEKWPFVASGRCQASTARAIFGLYFSQSGAHVGHWIARTRAKESMLLTVTE